MPFWRIILLVFMLSAVPSTSWGHKPSDSYLRLAVQETAMTGQWDIALRDLEYAIGLDEDRDGAITWGEVKARHDAITAYALARLRIMGDGRPCEIHPSTQLVDHHSDGTYTIIRFSVACPRAPTTVSIDYRLLFDLDALHRGLVTMTGMGPHQTGVFSPESPTWEFRHTPGNAWLAFAQFVREGIWHIWIGYDHILFLVSLLLPAVLRRQGGRWYPHPAFRPALWEVVKIVTAFTLAHSITLSLAALGLVTIPSRWVESVIAASVVLAALHNIYPILQTRIWVGAFGFGLIHGLGFASVLGDLELPAGGLIVALAGFNLGVELGQAALVGVLFPLAFHIRRTWTYQRLGLGMGSATIAAVGMVWLVERSFDLTLWPTLGGFLP